MTKLWITWSVVAVLLIGLLWYLIALLSGVHKSKVVTERDSAAYAEATMKAIASKWDAQELLGRIAPDDQNKAAEAEMVKAVALGWEKLGKIENLPPFERSEVADNQGTPKGADSVATVSSRAKFVGGEATLRFVLVKRAGRWTVKSFKMDDVKFIEPKKPEPSRAPTNFQPGDLRSRMQGQG